MVGTVVRLLVLLPLLVVCLSGVHGCSNDPAQGIIGDYQAESGKKLILRLKPGGEGEWTLEGETAAFTWEYGARGLILHTKGGGLIHGDVANDAVTLDLPAVGRITLHKQR